MLSRPRVFKLGSGDPQGDSRMFQWGPRKVSLSFAICAYINFNFVCICIVFLGIFPFFTQIHLKMYFRGYIWPTNIANYSSLETFSL